MFVGIFVFFLFESNVKQKVEEKFPVYTHFSCTLFIHIYSLIRLLFCGNTVISGGNYLNLLQGSVLPCTEENISEESKFYFLPKHYNHYLRERLNNNLPYR